MWLDGCACLSCVYVFSSAVVGVFMCVYLHLCMCSLSVCVCVCVCVCVSVPSCACFQMVYLGSGAVLQPTAGRGWSGERDGQVALDGNPPAQPVYGDRRHNGFHWRHPLPAVVVCFFGFASDCFYTAQLSIAFRQRRRCHLFFFLFLVRSAFLAAKQSSCFVRSPPHGRRVRGRW